MSGDRSSSYDIKSGHAHVQVMFRSGTAKIGRFCVVLDMGELSCFPVHECVFHASSSLLVFMDV